MNYNIGFLKQNFYTSLHFFSPLKVNLPFKRNWCDVTNNKAIKIQMGLNSELSLSPFHRDGEESNQIHPYFPSSWRQTCVAL